MATTTSAHIKNIRDSQNKENLLSRGSQETELLSEKKGKRSTPFELMQETVRYEKYCKYWSILSNIAAIVSVSGAIYGVMKKRRWF